MVVGNAAFVTAHFALGFLVGAYAYDLIRTVSGPALVVIALAALAGGGARRASRSWRGPRS